MTKYYIGLIPEESLSLSCQEYKQQAAELFDCHHAQRSPAHITLVAPFSSGRQQLALMKNLLSKIVPHYPAFNLKLSGWQHFKAKTIYLGVEATPELTALFNQCYDYLSQLVSPTNAKQFIPHISIINRDLSLEKFDDALAHFSQQAFPATATFAQLAIFELVKSETRNYWQIHQVYPLPAIPSQEATTLQMDSCYE